MIIIFKQKNSDIIIYTLIVIDLKKCNLILNNALEETTSIKDAKLNIIKNFAQFSFKSSLDTFFLILFIALGNLSDSNDKEEETDCKEMSREKNGASKQQHAETRK